MVELIQNGEAGLSVREKLNEVITNQNAVVQDSFFQLVENSIAVPISVPESAGVWQPAVDLQYTGLANGLYIIDAVMVIQPNTSSKSYQIRQVDKGVAYAGISMEATDSTNRLQESYRTFVNVTDGIIDTQIEITLETGQGSTDLIVEYTFYDVELKKLST